MAASWPVTNGNDHRLAGILLARGQPGDCLFWIRSSSLAWPFVSPLLRRDIGALILLNASLEGVCCEPKSDSGFVGGAPFLMLPNLFGG